MYLTSRDGRLALPDVPRLPPVARAVGADLLLGLYAAAALTPTMVGKRLAANAARA